MISVTKISDHKKFNLLQQVEMWLHHVYFHHTAIPHDQLRMSIASFQAKNFPSWRSHYRCLHNWNYFQASTVLKYRKLILFLHIVVWHMRVSTYLFEVTVQDAAMLSKTHFYFEFWKVLCDKCDSKQKNMIHVH